MPPRTDHDGGGRKDAPLARENAIQQGYQNHHDEDKVVVVTGSMICHDLVGIPMLEHAPVQGKTENAAQNIDEEDKELIRKNDLCPIQQFDNWFNDETDYAPWFLGVAASTAKIIYNKLNDNIDELKTDYDPTPYGLQQFIECEKRFESDYECRFRKNI